MKHHIVLASSLVLIASVVPAFAAAEGSYACTSDLPLVACAGEQRLGEGCDDPNGFRYTADEASVASDGLFAAKAGTWQSCYRYSSPWGSGSGHGHGVGAGFGSVLGTAGVGWGESHFEDNGKEQRTCAISAHWGLAIGIGGRVFEECAAGAPPNPGWGLLLP